FQAEDGIRDAHVTGVQTCALPISPAGKNDPRLRRAARLLARAGFAVAVPTVAGLARFRLDPDDVEPVVRTLQAMPPPATLVGIRSEERRAGNECCSRWRRPAVAGE